MHIGYNIKSAFKDLFYSVVKINYGSRAEDASALATLTDGVSRVRARDGHHYYYFFVKDVKDCDVVRFLMRRNGLNPEFHMSNYYGVKMPAFRIKMLNVNSQPQIDFIKQIGANVRGNDVAAMARYIDTIRTQMKRPFKTK